MIGAEMIGFLLYYVTEAVKFYFGYKLLFRERLTRLWMYPIGALVYAPVLFFFGERMSFDDRMFALSVIVAAATVLSVGSAFDHALTNTLILVVFIHSLDALLLILLKIHHLYSEGDIRDYVVINLIRMALLLITFIVLYEFRKLRPSGSGSNNFKLNKFLPYWGALFLNFILYNETTLLFSFADTVENTQELLLQILIATLSIILMIRMIIYSTNLNDRLNNTIALEKELSDMKTEYYEVLLRKEEDTRRYRHDMMNHYICMKQYAEEGKTAELSEYLSTLMGGLNRIRNESYYVGNKTIEIVLNYYLNSLGDTVQKSVTGMVPASVDVPESDLITIFGNLLSNASEELKRMEDKPSRISVEIKEGKRFFSVSISNSVSVKKQIGENLTVVSEKHDHANHGFGLQNVRNVVERNGGRLDLSCDDEAFTATVYLKFT